MSRHGILLIAHYQSRPLPFLLQQVCLAKALISGRDIEVMSRHLLFCVSSVLMSRPRSDVATLLYSHSSNFCVATSVLSCDHFDVCKTTSCRDLDFLVAILLVFFRSLYLSILCRDLMVMSRQLLLSISVLQVATSVPRCN